MQNLSQQNCSVRLPILDILNEFSKSTGTDPFEYEHEDRIVERLRDGDCNLVFGIDESGKWLLNRIYPELSDEARAVDLVGKNLRQFAPRSKDDILKFLALRRETTWDIFSSWPDGKSLDYHDCAVTQYLPDENRGYVFFREELLTAARAATGWSWHKLGKFRRDLRSNLLEIELEREFIAVTDVASFEFMKHWEARCFHKAHLVGWWQLIAATMSCKIRNAAAWEGVVRNWESAHGLCWNDFGAAYKEAHILTS